MYEVAARGLMKLDFDSCTGRYDSWYPVGDVFVAVVYVYLSFSADASCTDGE